MKVDNNSALSFGKMRFSKKAMEAISKRMPAGKFVYDLPAFAENHSINPIDIYVDTVRNSNRLVCSANWERSINNGAQFFQLRIKEGIMSRILSDPISFLTRIRKRSNKIAENFCRNA